MDGLTCARLIREYEAEQGRHAISIIALVVCFHKYTQTHTRAHAQHLSATSRKYKGKRIKYFQSYHKRNKSSSLHSARMQVALVGMFVYICALVFVQAMCECMLTHILYLQREGANGPRGLGDSRKLSRSGSGGSGGSEAQYLEAGFNDIIKKPLDYPELLKKIKVVLGL